MTFKRASEKLFHRGRVAAWPRNLVWIVIVLIAAGGAQAQTAAEYAGAASGMSTATVGAARPDAASAASPTDPVKGAVFAASDAKQKKPAQGTHLSQPTAADAQENRRALEAAAGEDAAKVLLRSEPTGAAVWIGGKHIGDTPLLLMLAPGAYRVELRGARMEKSERLVDVQPRETREVVILLEQRYPSYVKLR